uniref:Uncharacterized protein n=2 Tax=Aegilops tauschii subsp. strangulata TaxID=200361 RepID=A0A453H6S5_AEGTS
MAGACAVAAPSRATVSGRGAALPPGRGFRVSCRRSARRRVGGRARVSRDTNGAEAEPDSKGPIPQDDSGYLLTLGLGSGGGAATVKYDSMLQPVISGVLTHLHDQKHNHVLLRSLEVVSVDWDTHGW